MQQQKPFKCHFSPHSKVCLGNFPSSLQQGGPELTPFLRFTSEVKGWPWVWGAMLLFKQKLLFTLRVGGYYSAGGLSGAGSTL